MNKLKKISDYPFLIFLLFVVIAYFPVLLPSFHLKNDLVTQNLPTRYFISESLYSNYFPWWNPFIHFGIPQYGDMNNGFWNPIIWLFAKFFGYNIWTITYEEMLYILLGGWGIYKALKELSISKGIAILVALSYMSCGYIVGHLQHFCWITGTGFFPFVFLYFLRINKHPVAKNFIVGALFVLLFVSATHPGLIIGAIYFFIFCLLFIFYFRKTYCRSFYQPKFWLINLSFLLLSAIFSIVVIVSNLDELQNISRGSKVVLEQSLLQPTSFQCYLSLLLPLAVNKSSLFATDISMRNVYTGLCSVIGFIFLSKYMSKRILIAALIPFLFFVLLSSGGIFKNFFYHTLPLLGYVRLNGEFTYFVVLIIILFTAFTLQFLISDKNFEVILKKGLGCLEIILIIILIITLVFILSRPSSIIHKNISFINFKTSVKNILDNLYFNDLLFINAFIQILTIFFLKRKYSHKKSIAILAGNLIITTWLSLPFTGLGMASKKEMNRKMTTLPRGLRTQELQSLTQTKFLDSSLRNELWLLGSYSKKIGYPLEEQYPVQLNTTKKFFEDSALHDFINKQSFVFLSTDTTIHSKTNFDSSNIIVREFGAGYLKLSVNNLDYNFLAFLQNDYPYWQTFVNGKKETHFTVYKTFIGLPLKKGKQEIEYKFDPAPIRITMQINMAIIVGGLIMLTIPRIRNKRVFK